jgi:hypothetical protein
MSVAVIGINVGTIAGNFSTFQQNKQQTTKTTKHKQ